MISTTVNGVRFHYRVAAMVREGDYLLLHRRIGDDCWALPGGRVNAGERAQDAIQREFVEELGETITCGSMLHVGENFFEHQGIRHHEICLYFEANLPAGSRYSDVEAVYPGIEEQPRLEFRWFRLDGLKGWICGPRPCTRLWCMAPRSGTSCSTIDSHERAEAIRSRVCVRGPGPATTRAVHSAGDGHEPRRTEAV